MHYIIDAYNLLFHLSDKVHPIESARQDLIDSLTLELQNLKMKATLVFDSGFTHQSHYPHSHAQSSVEIIFSPQGMCADSYILELLQHSSNPKDITVITSDRLLRQRCKEQRAKTQSIESFLKLLKNRHQKFNPQEEKPQTTHSTYNAYLEKIFKDRLDQM